MLNKHKVILFPNPEEADNGIVGYGGNLSIDMLLSAYYQGIFPWYNEEDPLLWWSPDPRFVLFPEDLHVPDRLRRFMKNNSKSVHPFSYTMDADFHTVITSCSSVYRPGQSGTWIHPEIIDSYENLHNEGYAHSFETWQNGEIVGGFYGVQLGSMFFGESMFANVPDSSKCAFVTFVKNFRSAGGRLIDSQVFTDNIARFGGKNISRSAFLRLEEEYLPDELDQDLSHFYKDI